MNVMLSSIFGVMFVLIGLTAAVVMILLKGRIKDKLRGKLWIRLHRILGLVFVGMYLITLISMIIRISDYQEDFSPRIVTHLVLALSLFPLLLVKILIARRSKALTNRLFSLGVVISTLAFLFITITAGYYFLHRSDIKYVSLTEEETPLLDEGFGRQLIGTKCSQCHSLERVFRSSKSEEEWTKTVNRMAQLAAPNIRVYDTKQIIFFLIQRQARLLASGITLVDGNSAKGILQNKCTMCHDLERIYKADKVEDEWRSTVQRMTEMGGGPTFLDESQQEKIIEYLMAREK